VEFFELLFKVYFTQFEYVAFSILTYLRPMQKDDHKAMTSPRSKSAVVAN